MKTKTEVVVAVALVVVVAIRCPTVPGVVVPATAPIDPVGAIIDHYPLEERPSEDVLPEVIGVCNF
jgi:hypothetical protein